MPCLGYQATARIMGMSKPRAKEKRPALEGVGEFIHAQRRLAQLSLRQLAERAKVSNPYLSQIERGIYRPSAEVLKAIAEALDISADALYQRIGLVDPDRERPAPSVEDAVRLDPRLSTRQKETLLSVYRDFVNRD
jgi:transcriptional regulator with XRE-family HTH domain